MYRHGFRPLCGIHDAGTIDISPYFFKEGEEVPFSCSKMRLYAAAVSSPRLFYTGRFSVSFPPISVIVSDARTSYLCPLFSRTLAVPSHIHLGNYLSNPAWITSLSLLHIARKVCHARLPLGCGRIANLVISLPDRSIPTPAF